MATHIIRCCQHDVSVEHYQVIGSQDDVADDATYCKDVALVPWLLLAARREAADLPTACNSVIFLLRLLLGSFSTLFIYTALYLMLCALM